MCTSPVITPKGTFLCGKCVECSKAYSNTWAQRMYDEMKSHAQSCFLTLTYEKTDGDLHKDDLQKFLKRLRKAIHPQRIRYFSCGEYGSHKGFVTDKGLIETPNGRPHYHIIIFGFWPEDAKYITTKKGVDYYGSNFLAKVWQSSEKTWNNGRKGGFVSLTQPNLEACRYCAKYLQKLDERPHVTQPFTLMSRNPGIGAFAVSPDMLIDGLVYREGKSYPIPKFYLDKLEQMGYNVDVLKAKRQYLYENGTNKFDTYSAVDSARKRGKILEDRLKHMEGG